MRRLSLVLLAACVACGGENEPASSIDAGTDVSVVDATADGGDSGPNVGTGAPAGCGDGLVDSFETCDPPGSCPVACEPAGACFGAVLVGAAEWCTAECIDVPIVDCVDGDGCCSRGCSADDDDDCPGLCGNGVLDDGETCDDAEDCPTDCDDGDACTVDELIGAAATCNAACVSRPVVACVDGDGCCAAGCSAEQDDDCQATCGNGTLEPGERCDGDCAEACDDLDACHVGVLVGGATTCDARCELVEIDTCADGDGCCPIGCTDVEDDDCPSSCVGGGSDVEVSMRTTRASGDASALWSAAERLSTMVEAAGMDPVGAELQLALFDPGSGDRVPLASRGQGAFDVAVAAGTYDLVLEHAAPEGVGRFVLARALEPGGIDLGDLEFAAEAVRGAITVNGAAPPGTWLDSGTIWLRREPGGTMVHAGSTTEGAIDAVISSGIYDVVFVLESRQTVMPRNRRIVLRDDVALSSGATLNVDIETIVLHGDITIGGEAPSASAYDQGELLLRPEGSNELIAVARTSWGSWEATVAPGVYDLVYEVVAASTQAPRNTRAVLRSGLHLSASGRLDIDVPVVDVVGALSLGGAPFPDSVVDYGEVVARDTVNGAETLLAQTRWGSIDVRLVPGRYDLLYRADAVGAQTPWNVEAVLATDVLIDGTSLDIDVPAVTVGGDITIDGAVPPASVLDSGRIWLWDDATRTETLLGVTADGTWSARLIPGTYDVRYRHQYGTDVAPINVVAAVAADVSIAGGTLDIDVPAARVSGAITLDGALFPGGYNRARLVLVDEDGVRSTFAITPSATYDVAVVPGRYRVAYAWEQGSDIPRNRLAYVTGYLDIDADQVLDIDVVTQELGGGFTIDGQPFATLGGANQAAYSVVDVLTGERVELGRGSERSFSTRLITGRYQLRYTWEGGDDAPRNDDAELGCVDVIRPM